jgi:hypothetical protein
LHPEPERPLGTNRPALAARWSQNDAPGLSRETAKEAAMPLTVRQGTQEDLKRLPALVISFGRLPAAPADESETPGSEHDESPDGAAEGGRDG